MKHYTDQDNAGRVNQAVGKIPALIFRNMGNLIQCFKYRKECVRNNIHREKGGQPQIMLKSCYDHATNGTEALPTTQQESGVAQNEDDPEYDQKLGALVDEDWKYATKNNRNAQTDDGE